MNEEAGESAPGNGAAGDELFHLLVESAFDFAILSMDLSGRVTSWNVGAERLLGYSEAEIIGHHADIIFTPEDRAAGMPSVELDRALQNGRAEDERWHRRKDGSLFWASGLMMPLRDRRGFVKIMRDRTERRRADQRLAESEERFRLLATNIPQLVFRSRENGSRSCSSPQWEVYTGLSDDRSRDFGWLEAIHPDDRDATIEAWKLAAKSGRYAAEHRIRRHADGEYRWHRTEASPMPGNPGQSTEWVGASTDVHDLRALQERQQVLLAELQHRTRNLLALVQAIARRTMRDSSSMAEFASEYESRLMALSRVQSIVSSTSKGTVALRELIEAELDAHVVKEDGKTQVDGPDIDLPMGSVQILALALHELATNAVKYGAIGQPNGRLKVTWHPEPPGDGPPRVRIEWRESDVTMPSPEQQLRKGYGCELIERALPYQLNAETELEFGADGVRCVIAVPFVSAAHTAPGP